MSTYDAVKDAINLAKKYDQMELYTRLLDVREELNDLREENLDLKKRVKDLEEQAQVEQDIYFDKGVYWIRSDSKTVSGQDTPICPKCWDVDRVIVRQSIAKYGGDTGFRCASCDRFFEIRQY